VKLIPTSATLLPRRGHRSLTTLCLLIGSATALSGAATESLTQNTDNVVVVGSPRVAPDGHRIVFLVKRNGLVMLDVMDSDGASRSAVPGSENASVPSWSPDGRRLLFAVPVEGDTSSLASRRSEIVTMNVDGSDRRVVVTGVNYGLPTWSPNGKQVAFSAGAFPQVAIYSVALDGTDKQQLTHNEGFNYGAAWSPDGRRIAFVSARRAEHQQGRIYLIAADGADEHRLTASGGAHEYPAWSGDGRSIAFQVGDSATHDGRIFLVGSDGVNEHEITPHTTPLLDEMPSWLTPDRLVIQSTRDGAMGIYVIDTTGLKIAKLTPADRGESLRSFYMPPRESRLRLGNVDASGLTEHDDRIDTGRSAQARSSDEAPPLVACGRACLRSVFGCPEAFSGLRP
jgi:Tol biopolymer transport system component